MENSDEKLVFNNGVWLSRSGKAYQDEAGTQEIKLAPCKGYYVVPNEYLIIRDNTNSGQYIHRMMVYAFGDRNGTPYVKGMEIDHVDMDHSHNNIENLEVVSRAVNLARAVAKTPSKDCAERLSSYLRDLIKMDPLAAAIQIGEIEKDLDINIEKYMNFIMYFEEYYKSEVDDNGGDIPATLQSILE